MIVQMYIQSNCSNCSKTYYTISFQYLQNMFCRLLSLLLLFAVVRNAQFNHFCKVKYTLIKISFTLEAIFFEFLLNKFKIVLF